jgi:molybdenum cofactor guanylyltransferase
MVIAACFSTININKMDVTGIILAGGKSSRMGAEKGLVLLDNLPLIHYAIELLKDICNEIIISTNSDAYSGFGYRIVIDEINNIGPISGIYSSLKASSNEINFVLSCDLPFVTTSLVKDLLNEADSYKVVVPWMGGNHYEPLCACYKKSVLPDLEVFISNGYSRLPDFFNQVSCNRFEIGFENYLFRENTFLNINSQNDLQAAEKLIKIIKY